MSNLKVYRIVTETPVSLNRYDSGELLANDKYVTDVPPARDISPEQRERTVETVIRRFFVGKAVPPNHGREAIARSINPGPDFMHRLTEEEELAEGGFGPELTAPSASVEAAFRAYAHTELGAVALARLIKWDNTFIEKKWRKPDGALTEAGIKAYGDGLWRPFRVASNGEESDTVTQSGAMVLPDNFPDEEFYSTGDVLNPLAILHHELMAHVLPLKAAEGLEPGREMELICIRFESEMLRELGLRERHLNWGKDDGTLDHTLHEPSEQYFEGLVRYNRKGELVEIDPETDTVIGPAKAIATA